MLYNFSLSAVYWLATTTQVLDACGTGKVTSERRSTMES
jgi:hypothetical protein